MAAAERISEGEAAVMEVLWAADGPLAAGDVIDRVAPDRRWTAATVKTLLARLVSKGALAYSESGRRYLYSPAISRDNYVGGESRRLVDRLFGGRAAPLVAHLAEAGELTEQDIVEIEALLRELKK